MTNVFGLTVGSPPRPQGFPEGYGFVEFRDHAAAERILRQHNGAARAQGRGEKSGFYSVT